MSGCKEDERGSEGERGGLKRILIALALVSGCGLPRQGPTREGLLQPRADISVEPPSPVRATVLPRAPALPISATTWSFSSAPHAQAQVVSGGDVLQIGAHGRRWVIPRAGETRHAEALAPSTLVDVRLDGTRLEALGDEGSVYVGPQGWTLVSPVCVTGTSCGRPRVRIAGRWRPLAGGVVPQAVAWDRRGGWGFLMDASRHLLEALRPDGVGRRGARRCVGCYLWIAWGAPPPPASRA